jgi:HEPN domain-containing protein
VKGVRIQKDNDTVMDFEKVMVFDQSMCEVALPGILYSIEVLSGASKHEQGKISEMGFVISAVVICAHAAELLLKYKIEREGKSFEEIHDLYKLYQQLEDESKEEIEREFNRLLSEANSSPDDLPNGWNSAESVFERMRNASVEWRYVVEAKPKKPRQSPDANIGLFYTAILSVFYTTSLAITRTAVKTVVKAEDLPADIRARASNYGFIKSKVRKK